MDIMSGLCFISSTRCGKRPLAMPYWMIGLHRPADQVAQPLPAGQVEVGELGAVRPNLFVERVRPVKMADAARPR